MLTEIVLESYLKWVKGLKTNLIAVRGGIGQLTAESIPVMPDNLIRAKTHVEQVKSLLSKQPLDKGFVHQMTKKCDVWLVVFASAISREGVDPVAVDDMIGKRELTIDEATEVSSAYRPRS